MRIYVRLEVEVERDQGKFASRSDLEDAVQQMIEDANYGQIDGLGSDGDSTYLIEEWDVMIDEPPKKGKK